jgi:hypothetical protein
LGALLVLAMPSAAGPWPEPTAESRPWTRWWWLGSAVDEGRITAELEGLQAAGIGGVEITAIYGVRGQEARHIDYLSDHWLEMVRHACREAKRLGVGVDLPPGSGWRCGGPAVTRERSACFFGTSEENGGLGLAFTQGRERVKRPGPGGAGLTIDVYDATATASYFAHFNERLAKALPPGAIRAQFHDSFEYGSDWSRELTEVFRQQHGYDVAEHLATLVKARERQALSADEQRVVYDYRRTLEDMYLANFLGSWNRQSHEAGMLTRNQGHGTPANILDAYAAADIPETEIFRDTVNPLVNKLASSAGHVAGRQRISCESFTWLSEHFQSDLGRLKHFTDYLFLCGINHIVFHGTTYSPDDAAWPGWLFYASSQINPRNPIWRDLPALNAYITRCQSLLQAGQPDHDVLLYWPIDDDWMEQDGLRSGFSIDGGHWRVGKGFRNTAKALWDARILFDYVSDRQLAAATADDNGILMPGGVYRAIVLPPLRFLRPETAANLLRIAQAGADVVLLGSGSTPDAPGRAHLADRRRDLRQTWARLQRSPGFRAGGEVLPTLATLEIRPDSIQTTPDLRIERRRLADGSACYFLANRGPAPIRDRVLPSRTGDTVCLLDPWTGRAGWVEPDASGRIPLVLEPGETRFLVMGPTARTDSPWRDDAPDPNGGEPVPGPWRVSFVAGGPVRPPARIVARLTPYTSWPDAELQRFAGTARYEADLPATIPAGECLLDLGEVHGSARVFVNGQELGVRVAAPYRFTIPHHVLRDTGNLLAVEVTGTAANRIRDLDRRGVPWRIFHDINFVNREYRPFDASDWPTVPAGLVGPVRLHAILGVR